MALDDLILAQSPNFFWRLTEAASPSANAGSGAATTLGTEVGTVAFGATGLDASEAGTSVDLNPGGLITSAAQSAINASNWSFFIVFRLDSLVTAWIGGVFSAFSSGSLWAFIVNADGSISSDFGSGASTAASAAGLVTTGVTYTALVAYDGATTTQRLYLNGNLVATNTASPGMTAGGSTLRVGSAPWDGVDRMDGRIQHAAIFPATLTETVYDTFDAAARGTGVLARTVTTSAALRKVGATRVATTTASFSSGAPTRTVPTSAALSGAPTRTVPVTAALGSAIIETWHQHGGYQDRRGGNDITPLTPWRWLWSDGPDADGGLLAGRRYAVPPEAFPVCGGTRIVQPRGGEGLYAFTLSTGAVSWTFPWAEFVAAGAYHVGTATFWFGSTNGRLYKIPATGIASDIREYDAGSPIRKAVAIDGNFAYCVCEDGSLHKVSVSQTPALGAPLVASAVYGGGSTDDAVRGAGLRAEVPPAISASGKVVYATSDGFVHCVLVATLRRASGGWRVAPHNVTWGGYVEWSGWPVIAEAAGVLLLRCQLAAVDGGGAMGEGPSTVSTQPNRFPASTGAGAAQADAATIKAWFGTRAAPGPGAANRNLFAISLADGSEAFVPAVGYGSTEGYANGRATGEGPPPPVVKRWVGDALEVAYIQFRNGSNGSPDFRWDNNLGEMPLAGATVSGYTAGDVRFVAMGNAFAARRGFIKIIDESCPLSFAGDAIFNPHWDGNEGVRVGSRVPSLGDAFANPIASTDLPYVARSAASAGTRNAASHYRADSGNLFDTRYVDPPMYWVYFGVHDPPSSPAGVDTYSSGVLPRYAFVHQQYLVVSGNGGDLTVFRHSGTSPNGTWTTPTTPTALTLTGPASGKVLVASDKFTLALSPKESIPTTGITCTLSDGAQGGVFKNEAGTTITTIILTATDPAQRFSYTPEAPDAGATIYITVTNDGGLTNP